MRLQNKVALLTGASGGIGVCAAERLVREGAYVILLDRSPKVSDVADQLAQKGHGAEAIVGDITDVKHMHQVATDSVAKHGRVDILVNNAGIQLRTEGKKTSALDISLDDWRTMLNVNLTGAFILIRELVPGMVSRGWGRVINMSSLGGRIGSRFNGMHYSATKAGLIGMSRTLALEVSRSGVTVNCIAPGRIATEDNKRFGTAQTLIDNYIPAGRLGTPEDVAAAICFLASDDASYITGIALDVNGGFYMG
jgi:3-oxoacyl-[acyl-carrier protein] reductase